LCSQPPRLSPKEATKDGSKIPVPCSTATSTASPSGKPSATSSVAGSSTTTTTTITASRARRPSTLQYCLKSTALPRLAPPPPTPPTQQPDDRLTTEPDQEVAASDRSSTIVPTRQSVVAAAVSVWPTKIVAPKATPEDSLIDSCSTDGDDDVPEYRLLSLAGDEIGDHLRATANTSHLDLLNSVSAPIADEDDDVDDDFDLSEGRPVELCRDEVPPASVAASAAAGGSGAVEDSSPDPFRYVDVLAARTVSVVNSCDATGFPQRRPWHTALGHDRLVGSGTSLPARLAVASSSSPRQSRSSTLPRSAASLLQRAACGDSSSDAETLTPAASTRSSLSGIASATTLTKKQSLTLSVGGAVGGESAGRLSASAVDSPTLDAAARLSPDSPVSRFCHLGAHALDVFYSPGDDDDDGDDAGVVSPLPASTAASGAGTFWRPVACTAAVDRRRRPTSPPSLSQLIKHRSPPTYRRPRLYSPPPPPPTVRPSAAPLVEVIEGFSDVECASISDEEENEACTTIRPPRPTGLPAAPSAAASAAQLSPTELQQSSRSCSKHEASGSQSTWLTMPAESSTLHRDGHSPATDTVWPAETLRPRYRSRYLFVLSL